MFRNRNFSISFAENAAVNQKNVYYLSNIPNQFHIFGVQMIQSDIFAEAKGSEEANDVMILR